MMVVVFTVAAEVKRLERKLCNTKQRETRTTCVSLAGRWKKVPASFAQKVVCSHIFPAVKVDLHL